MHDRDGGRDRGGADEADRVRLGEILMRRGELDSRALDATLDLQSNAGGPLGRLLVERGEVSALQVLDALAEQLGLERVDLQTTPSDEAAVRVVPEEFARAHELVPLAVIDGCLHVATAEPGRFEVIEDLRLLSGLEVVERVASREDVRERIAECYQVTVERMVGDLSAEDGPDAASASLHDIEVMASEPTVVNLVNVIISTALRERASDIHLVPFESTLELRYRVDGVLRVVPPPPKNLHAAIVSRIKIMADMNIAERFLPQDGHIQIRQSGRRVDVRVGTMPTVYGESVVMRLLEKSAGVQSLAELGFDEDRARRLERIVEKPHGIVLSTGPTGSGKTTTLYSLLSGLYTTERKILTIEDPVEYELAGVAQIPVRPGRGFTFASGLRAILRQDPDVIMVGEIRDSETAEIAIRAALTGHLVFSTLHTNDAPGAVARLVDMGIEPFLIASSLEAVLAQRLVRRICEGCRRQDVTRSEAAEKLQAAGVGVGAGPFWRGAGCRECRQCGYLGRVGLFELLVLEGPIRDLVLSRASSRELRLAAMGDMTTILEDGLRKAERGVTSLEEVVRVAVGDAADESTLDGPATRVDRASGTE